MQRSKTSIFFIALAFTAVWLLSDLSLTPAAQELTPIEKARIQLGKRIFQESRFSTPKGDLPASCATCHLYNEDPQGLRAYSDFFNRSWFSHRTQDPRRFHPRNSPILLDVALQPTLHYDGEFPTLEALVKGTFAGRPMGWLPGEEAEAYEHLRNVLLSDATNGKSPSYRQAFQESWNVNIAQLSAEACAEQTAKAVAVFLRTLRSKMNAPYDQFVRENQLSAIIANQDFETLLAKLSDGRQLKFAPAFDAETLRGMEIFFRTKGEKSVGNCVTCHRPPLFTDFSFHNIGVSQAEYDGVHGAGSFTKLTLPTASASRPVADLRMIPERQRPEYADLGHWNFVNLKASPLRRAGESEDRFLERMAATFKTPALRHLAFSQPYLHNGAFTDLAETLREKIRLSQLAREGKLRAADDELERMRLNEADVAPLVKFLQTLNENLSINY